MKKLFTYLILLVLAIPGQAQITIERSDYTREVGSMFERDSLQLNPADFKTPSEGLNQVWDYSNVTIMGRGTQMIEAGNHADIPSANIASTTNDAFLGLLPQTFTFYQSLTEEHLAAVGRLSTGLSASIAALSGGANDTITVTGDLNIYEEPSYAYQFPINFGDAYDFAFTIDNNYVLTVEAFGLDHVPGVRRTYVSGTHEVVGAGTLIVPNPNGTGKIAVEVLLQKEQNTSIDSTFLGGQPAPPALLGTFGLTQGSMSTSTTYTFIAKGLPRSAFVFNQEDGAPTFAYLSADLENIGIPLDDVLTIERSDYTREVGSVIDDVIVDVEGLFVPSEGAGSQVWDYSNLSITDTRSRTIMAGGHPDFPESNMSQTSTSAFLGLIPQEITFHENLSDNSYVTLGRTFTGGAASLTSISGGPNDSLVILDGINIYDSPSPLLEFPIQFGRSNSNDNTLITHAILTVEGFGVDHAPVFRKGDLFTTETVSGYGTLLLPHPDGAGTISLEVLLTKEETFITDSLFLNGALAPAALSNAFGLESASALTRTRYTFVTKGLNRSAFTFIVTDNVFSGASFADGIRDLMTSTTQVAHDLLDIQTFPNPSDGHFTIAFDKTDGADWILNLYNPIGQQIQRQILDLPAGKVSIRPTNKGFLQTGTYFLTIHNAAGQLVGVEKVLVKK